VINDLNLARYGHVPYGKNIIGKVALADPIDACSHLNNTEE